MKNHSIPDAIRADSSPAVSRLTAFINQAESGPRPCHGAARLDLLVGICRQVRDAITTGGVA